MLAAILALAAALPPAAAAGADVWARAQQVSREPPVYVIPDFLSADECRTLRELGGPHLSPAGTAGKQGVSNRTSFSMFLDEEQERLPGPAAIIDHVIDAVMAAPVAGAVARVSDRRQAEQLQVQRYEAGQFYQAHFDYSSAVHAEGNRRIVTVLMYLADVEEGGHTVFPLLEEREPGGEVAYNADRRTCREVWCSEEELREHYAAMPYCCCTEALRVAPREGTAVVFWPQLPDGGQDHRTWHGACPIVKGTKWTAQQWFHSTELLEMAGSSAGVGGSSAGGAGSGEGKAGRKKRKKRRRRAGDGEL